MSKLSVAITASLEPNALELISTLAATDTVGVIFIFGGHQQEIESISRGKARWIEGDISNGGGLIELLSAIETEYLLIINRGETIKLGAGAIERLISVAQDSGAGILYSDFRDESDAVTDHPLIDYQAGSIRDSFDFGSLILLSTRAIQSALKNYGQIEKGLRWGALYDLRLKISIDSQILRIPEPLYTRVPLDRRASGEKQFDYVDPKQRDYQVEMESIARDQLDRIGAHIDFRSLRKRSVQDNGNSFPVRASVVIPVRNRERTIVDAINSALGQAATFDFNVIVVDNHSTDSTTNTVAGLAAKESRVVHLQPERTDLGIGGCWNQALFSDRCGEFAVQLDSDDLYADQNTLARVMSKFDEGEYAMVIGSYTIVNFDLEPIPPGVIDHREWTSENGHNNALRINGLGAPRAFWVPLLRSIGGLPNTSYGEDYATALRICREYEIGRIYEPIYFARRWEGNSDAALPLAVENRYDAYKDYLRTVEISARISLNKSGNK